MLPGDISSQTQTELSNETNLHLVSDENNDEPSSSSNVSDLLAKGVSSLLGTVMKDFDSKAENTLKSQEKLCFAIDRLTGELDQLLEDAPLPFIMQHAVKISGVRKRVSSLNLLLKSIQRRIDNIDRMLSIGSSHEKSVAGNDMQHQH